MTRSRFHTALGGLALPIIAGTALLSAACGGQVDAPRPKAQPAASTSTAPAVRRVGAAAVAPAAASGACAATGAHDKHLTVGIACANCHPCGGQYGFDVPFTYPQGTTSAGGTVTRSPGAPTTCSVGCHAPLGTPPTTIAWNTAGPLACTACHAASSLAAPHPSVTDTMTRADCQGCHNTGTHGSGTITLVGHAATWMNQFDAGFHAYAAERGLANCQQCHLQNLSGTANAPACNQCHRAGGTGNDLASCTGCHGGTDNQTGAPPRAIWGYTNDLVRVGAHTSHIAGSAIAPAFDCGVCHVKPADMFAAGHIDEITGSAVPTASVVFSGLASGGVTPAPSWDRTAGTCSNTYCHGATLRDGSNTMPIWTQVGQGQAACGTCHGVPPTTNHPAVSPAGGLAACNPCHSGTIDAAGNLIAPSAGGKHLNGNVEATGHSVSWMDQTSTDFHAFSANRGIANCQSCHGADLSGGSTGVACAQCHGTSWATNCTMCHGGANATGAPPRPTWGNTDPLAVGAHSSHVTATHGLTAPIPCDACHVKPLDAFTAGHVDGQVAVTGYNGTGTLATAVGTASPWNGATGTCATYCHGGRAGAGGAPALVGGNVTAPVWTDVGGAVASCDGCHGNPPDTGTNFTTVGTYGNVTGHMFHVTNIATGYSCGTCHRGLWVDLVTPPPIDPALHIDGALELGKPLSNGTFLSFVPCTTDQNLPGYRCLGCHAACRPW